MFNVERLTINVERLIEMADTGVRGLLYGVSAINILIFCWLSSLGGGWQVEKGKKNVIRFASAYLKRKSFSLISDFCQKTVSAITFFDGVLLWTFSVSRKATSFPAAFSCLFLSLWAKHRCLLPRAESRWVDRGLAWGASRRRETCTGIHLHRLHPEVGTPSSGTGKEKCGPTHVNPHLFFLHITLSLNHNFTTVDSSFVSDPRGAIFICALATNR